ncbi:transposase [Acerihabitans sp.]|uniref:transposase n=1 Tax=Acerihabitans sp. TaxID=2811394 RepID=UPI0039C8B814
MKTMSSRLQCEPFLTSFGWNIKPSKNVYCWLRKRIEQHASADDTATRLTSVPGIGKLTATAITAFAGNGNQFKSGRDLAAWLGLVPREYSTGGKQRLLGISKRGNPYRRHEPYTGYRRFPFERYYFPPFVHCGQ